MADKYLLTCECEAKHPVGAHQAGSQLACECGRTLQVPRLGELRQLPREEAATTAAAETSRWGVGQSVVMAGLTIGLLALAVGLWAHFSMPSVSKYRDVVGEWSKAQLEEWLAQATPADTYRVWNQELELLTTNGFTRMEGVGEIQVQAREARQGMLRNASFVLAALSFGLAIVGYFVAWQRR